MRAALLSTLAFGCGGEAWPPARTVPAPLAASPPATVLTWAELADAAPTPLPLRSDDEAAAIALMDDVMARYELNERAIAGPVPGVDLVPTSVSLVVGERRSTLAGTEKWQARGRGYVLADLEALQADADQREARIDYLRVEVRIDGDEATLAIGFDFLLPSSSSEIYLCCGVVVDEYKRPGAAWIYVRRRMVIVA